MNPAIKSGDMVASEAALKNLVEKPATQPDLDPPVIRPLPARVEQQRGSTPDAFWAAASGLDHLDEMSEARAQIDLSTPEARAEIAALESVQRTVDEINATQPMSLADRDVLVEQLFPAALAEAKRILAGGTA